MARQRILCFASYFLPGFRAGGPIRSLQRLIDGLRGQFEFAVVTRDRDLGTQEPYPHVAAGQWNVEEGIPVWHLRPPHWMPGVLGRLVDGFRPDLLYFHSFLDPSLVAMPLLLRRVGRLPAGMPALVAPRGEFAPSALALKGRRKAAWLALVKGLGLYRDVTWQATDDREAEQIRAHWGPGARVLLAPNLPPRLAGTGVARRQPKVAGALRLVFLSRISPMKNLTGALRLLGAVRVPVSLDIYGAKESAEYWAECEQVMQALPPHVTATFRGIASPDDVIPLLSSYDVFLLPTLGENFGHVILEALLAGCPVVISDRTPWRNLAAKGAGHDLSLERPGDFVAVLEEFAAMDDAQFQSWSAGAARLGRDYCHDSGLAEQAGAALRTAMALPGRNHATAAP